MPKHKFFDLFRNAVTESHRVHFLIIFILAALLLFANLHVGGLSGYDDAFYAHEGRQMLAVGDWQNVRFNGQLNFEYPPLFIWLEAVSFFVFGVSDFAAKFPSALLGLLTIALVFFLAKQLSESFWLPVVSAWILMLSQYFMKYATHSMTDVPFAFFFTLAVFCYVKGLKQSFYFVLCGVAVALGIMTRSVIGLLPVAVIFSHLILTKRFYLFRSKQFWTGVLLVLLIPAAWYFPQYQTFGERFVIGHFGFVNAKFASAKPFELAAFLRGLIEYPTLLVKLYEPWIWLTLVGLAMHAKRAIREKNASSMLLCLWVAFVFIPFSFADAKVLRYILSAFPAFSIIAATPASEWLETVKRSGRLTLAYAVLCFAVVLIVIFPNPRFRAEEMMKMSPAIRANTPERQRIIFYTGADVKFDFHNQLLWYSNRFTELVTDEEKLKEKLYSEEPMIFVMDKTNFRRFSADPQLRLQVFEESENFVCFKTNPSG